MKKIDINKNLENIENDPAFENEFCVAVRSDSLNPTSLVGSYVIIPKSQVSSPFDLSEEEWIATRNLMHEVKAYIDKKYKPDGYNLGWNVGEVGGQNVAHAHFHILPRYADEPYAGKGIRAWLKKDENTRKCFLDEKQKTDV